MLRVHPVSPTEEKKEKENAEGIRLCLSDRILHLGDERHRNYRRANQSEFSAYMGTSSRMLRSVHRWHYHFHEERSAGI